MMIRKQEKNKRIIGTFLQRLFMAFLVSSSLVTGAYPSQAAPAIRPKTNVPDHFQNIVKTPQKSLTISFQQDQYLLTITKDGTGSGTVTSDPVGIDCGVVCNYDFGETMEVTLIANADIGSTFSGWSGACSGNTDCIVTLSGDEAVTASFTLNQYQLSITKGGNGSGTVSSNPAGIVCGATCSANFDYDTPVTLSAVNATGSTFTGWSGEGCSGTGTCMVTMSAARSVTANFTLNQYQLSVSKSGNGSGTVSSNPAGIVCGVTCAANYNYNTSVTLSAVADTGSTFTGWSGEGCSGTGDCVVSMTAARSVTATFTLNPYQLTVSKSGNGSGTVSSNPAGIACGATCAANYNYNTSVTLSAVADTGSTFTGWSGEGCTGTGTCIVTVNAVKSVTATFTLNQYQLSVNKGGTGSGTVSSNPAGIACGSTCAANYNYNTSVTLSAVADTGSTFTGWSGEGCTGTGNCVVTVSAAKSVTANFTLLYLLTVNKSGAGSGTITSVPAGIDCGITCTHYYDFNTLVTLSAVAAPGSTFTGWSGEGCSGTGTCPATMTAARSVTANFTLNQYQLVVSKSGNGSGTVSSNPAGIVCGATCSANYNYNTSVTLSAVADTGSTFTGWSGEGCTGIGTCVVTVNAVKSVTAAFTLNQYQLSVIKSGTGSGIVISNPAGIACGATCATNFNYNTAVTLTATADIGTVFAGWSGQGCTGTGACVVTVSAAKSVTASFTLLYLLTVNKSGTGSGTVTSVPAGIACGITCTHYYNFNTLVTLSATAVGSTFTSWSGEGCTGTGNCVVTMSAARSVTANFTLNQYQLNVSKTGNGTGTVSSNPAGIACGVTCAFNFNYNTVVTLTATTATGSTFIGWSGEGCTGAGTCVVTMSAARSVTANFTLNLYQLSVTKGGNGSGTVTSHPTGIACGVTCAFSFNYNTVITLTATADIGSVFTGWSGEGCAGTGVCVVTVSAAKAITANFTLLYLLTVNKSGTGSGTVTSIPAGIACGITCTHYYNFNTLVTLSAVAATGSSFTGWSGEGCMGTGACVVTMSAARSVTASFTLNPYTVSVTKIGNGSGTINSNPAGIACGMTCAYTFSYNTVVTLTATAATGTAFTGWSGEGCTGTGACVVTVNAIKSITASFTLNLYQLSIAKSGTGSGTVSSNPAGISCSPTCAANFNYNTVVTLTATAAVGSVFTGWSGQGCTGTGTCVVTVNAAKSVTAGFTLLYLLEVNKSGPGSGTVSSVPEGIACGITCTHYYDFNTQVTLSAVAATGSTFIGWSGDDCTGIDSCVVTMNAYKTVKAKFALNPYELIVTKSGNGSGVVSSNPAGIACGATCTSNFDYSTVVTLTAIADIGSSFAGWSGEGCTGTGNCVVTVSAVKSVSASFTLNQYPLSIMKSGDGFGTVSGNPAGIACGVNCSSNFEYNTVVTLTATADIGSAFTGWSGEGCTGTGVCIVTMSATRAVTARFALLYLLTVNMSGTGSGILNGIPAGIACGITCTHFYDFNTLVTLSAIAAAGSTFTGWSGEGCTGTSTCPVTMSTARSVTANFTLNQYQLSITKSGNGSGTVNITPAGSECTSTCASDFFYNTVVTLTATPAPGWRFFGWEGDLAGLTNPITITMDENKSVTAVFNKYYVFLPAVQHDPIFTDYFNYDSSEIVFNNWEIVPDPDLPPLQNATWFLLNGGEFHGKHMVADHNSKAAAKVYQPRMPASYSVKAKVKLASGSNSGARGGLMFDFLDNTRTYRFVITPGSVSSDNWMVQKLVTGTWIDLAQGRVPNMLSREQYNLLQVNRQGASIKVYLNDALLWSGSDTTYQNGRVGLIIGTPAILGMGDYAEIIFDDFVVDNQ
jgi:hypothetical protein